MELSGDITDFFGLVTELCKTLLEKSSLDKHGAKHDWVINKMRKKAFEIFLNKRCETYNINDNQEYEGLDPTVDIFKYAFVLRCTYGLDSKARKLEDAVDQLLEERNELDVSLKSILVFFSALKSYQTAPRNDLNIFYYGEKNPALPDPSVGPDNVAGYQIYPSSAFELPYKIDSDNQSKLINFSSMKLDAPFSFSAQLQQNLAYNEPSSLIDFQSKHLMLVGSTNFYLFNNNDFQKPVNDDKVQSQEVISFDESIKDIPLEFLLSSAFDPELKENRTWETLGNSDDSKHVKFILESDLAIQHLENFRQWPDVSGSTFNREKVQNVISIKEFIDNVKLVLLGIESECFWWNSTVGYVFKVNMNIIEISNEAIKDISSEITHWATCFKLLSILVQANPDSIGKLRQDGLILKAMCSNVGDVLLHYQAVIHQIFNDSLELLQLLHRLRPMGELISEVARLCKCDNTMQTMLGEGTGILSHIYKEVTRITKPSVALVYYSVLKSCCEVYFQMLEKWIFEGACDETHGEFMIKIRSQYLRNRGHRFWSKCFGIHRDSVPGFLENLTESILRCGKAVRLLKICDPKNALCSLFSTSRPSVKVCLNVDMLLRQEEICQDYLMRGIEVLGENVSVSSALEQLRVNEKVKAAQVAVAQQGFFDRIKQSQKEEKLLLVKNKQDLLAELKNQAEEAITRKEKAKEAQLLEDRLLMEQAAAEDVEFKNQQIAEAKQTIEYYKELAEEANKRRLRALWREKRMSLFEERVESIIAARQNELLPEIIDNSQKVDNDVQVSKDENSNRSTDKIIQENKTGINTVTPRPKMLPVKSNNIKPELVKTIKSPISEMLDKILKRNRSSPKTRTLLKNEQDEISNLNPTEDILKNVIDKEGNESTDGSKLIDLNENKSLPDENLEIVDNINSEYSENVLINSTDIAKILKPVTNDLNDFTPMSCTTDIYLHSAASSSAYYSAEVESCIGSKNDLETPLTPGDCDLKSEMKRSLPTSQSFFTGFNFDRSTSVTFDSSLTIADVELIDNTSLRICLEKSVVIPLIVQSRLANSAVIKYLLHEHKILSHFQSLRSFFFLLNGEFAKNLSAALYTKFYEISMPVELFNSATLTNLLENALHSSLNCSYKNSELLTLSANEVPARLQVSDPEALDCLCLNYRVSWPLNIILDESLMQQYSKVFKFLMMVGRVLWVLQEDFSLLKVEKKAAMSPQYHKLQLYRHAMMQFMTAFNNYLTCSVLRSSWAEFEKDLESTTTLDHIYSTHVTYIKKILSRCMLTSRAEKLRKCLISIFKIILQFHNCLRSHEWKKTANGYTHSNYNKLEQMYKAFCELRTYPAIVVEKLANSGYQSHLTHFVDALNINPLYNLSTKGM